jgi:aspartate oxidase
VSEYLETEVLILGSGIAGATAALELADRGVQVTVATRAAEPEDSNTLWAQGGIIYRGEGDSPAALVQDILHAGAGHSFPPAAQILAEEGAAVAEATLAPARASGLRSHGRWRALVGAGGGATPCRAFCMWPTTPARLSSWP